MWQLRDQASAHRGLYKIWLQRGSPLAFVPVARVTPLPKAGPDPARAKLGHGNAVVRMPLQHLNGILATRKPKQNTASPKNTWPDVHGGITLGSTITSCAVKLHACNRATEHHLAESGLFPLAPQSNNALLSSSHCIQPAPHLATRQRDCPWYLRVVHAPIYVSATSLICSGCQLPLLGGHGGGGLGHLGRHLRGSHHLRHGGGGAAGHQLLLEGGAVGRQGQVLGEVLGVGGGCRGQGAVTRRGRSGCVARTVTLPGATP